MKKWFKYSSIAIIIAWLSALTFIQLNKAPSLEDTGNDYFDASTYHVTPGERARVSHLNDAYDAIEVALDKLPGEDELRSNTVYDATDSGAADAYVLTLSYYTAASYTDGMVIKFKASATNTGASTVNLNSIGTKSLLRNDGSALSAGDVEEDEHVVITYNSTSDVFKITGTPPTGAGTMASQNANSVAITGGSVGGVTGTGNTWTTTTLAGTTTNSGTISGGTVSGGTVNATTLQKGGVSVPTISNSQDGSVSFTDTGSTTLEYPFALYTPNVSDLGSAVMLLGKDATTKDYTKIQFYHESNGSDSNKAIFGIGDGAYADFTGGATIGLHGATTITDLGSTTSEIPATFLVPNIANAGSVYAFFGKELSSNNYGLLQFYHASDGSSSNYAVFNVNGGVGLKLGSDGTATLNSINILPTSTTVSGSGDIASALFRLSMSGKQCTMTWASLTFTGSTNAAVSSAGTIASAYRPVITAYSGLMRENGSNVYRVAVTSAGTITIQIYDWSGSDSAVTGLSNGGTMSWILS